MERRSSVYIDGHVHVYERSQCLPALAAASDNVTRNADRDGATASNAVLLLADPEGVDGFDWFCNIEKANGDGDATRWHVAAQPDEHTVHLRADGHVPVAVVSGHQAITAENLEALVFPKIDLPSERLALFEVIRMSEAAGALVILPWGAGKWLGRRGRVIDAVIEAANGARVCVADNGGRWQWPGRVARLERARQSGLRCVSGTDPLPLPGEERRVGAFGVRMSGSLGIDERASDILDRLTSAPLQDTGRRLPMHRFLFNQVALRLR